MNFFKRIFGLFPKLWGNWISLLGTTLTTVAGNGMLIVTVVDIVSGGSNHYTATFGYLLMPPLFVLGLGLIALGVWRDHRRGVYPKMTPLGRAVDMAIADPSSRRRLIFVLVATLSNVTLISIVAYQAISYMESPRFCGQLCHSVMKPEHQAYLRSPHARVPCVDCHIGEGASWFVRSKLSGMRQVWATVTGNFSRPIPTPIHHLRPARETCEKCHWPEKFNGARLLVHHSYKDDQANTRLTNVVRLNVGGLNKASGRFEGIHWHVGPDVHVEYEALDAKRRTIGQVVLTVKGQRTVYLPPKGAQNVGGFVERRVMDCVDCHNRPTHIYDISPEGAVDRALSYNKLDSSLPFLHQQAVALLKMNIEPPEEAGQRFTAVLQGYYAKNFPELAQSKGNRISQAAQELSTIYQRNIFPKLKITWSTYPSHLGHRQTTEGCFRCHDDEHQTKDGKVIRKDCDVCHEVLAEEEEKPDVPENVLRLGRM